MQSKSSFRGEISIQSVTSKLALLTMHFPKVSRCFDVPPMCMHVFACMRVCVHCGLHVIGFPLCQQLKLLWTQTPHATAALFEELKVSILKGIAQSLLSC